MEKKFEIIYEDDDILVIDKPAGLVVEKTGIRNGTIEDILRTDYRSDLPRGGVVHRLDKDTSGVMVVAKNEKTMIDLQSQFASRAVEKIYKALVYGKLEPGRGSIDLPIKRDPKNPTRYAVSRAKDAKPSVTDYAVEQYYSVGKRVLTLLDALPKTGRTHQIRVHFYAIKTPIVGDAIYRNSQSEEISKELGLSRQFLHASSISFMHPGSGKRVDFSSELSDDLKKTISQLEK